MAEFFHMDGYGGYVWTAYGISALVIGALVVAIWRRRAHLEAQLREKDQATEDHLRE